MERTKIGENIIKALKQVSGNQIQNTVHNLCKNSRNFRAFRAFALSYKPYKKTKLSYTKVINLEINIDFYEVNNNDNIY